MRCLGRPRRVRAARRPARRPPDLPAPAAVSPSARTVTDFAAAPAAPLPAASHFVARPVDRTLNELLLAVERDMQIALTVNINGSVVTGTLVSTAVYYRTLADQFVTAEGGTDMDELFAEAFRGIIDDASRLEEAASRGSADGGGPPVEFRHLTDARFVSGGAFLPHGRRPGVLWRCRVADVSGWNLGDMTLS